MYKLIILGFLFGVAPTMLYAKSDKTLEQCRAKLKAAQKLDLLYDLKFDGTAAPTVVVGPTYETLPFDARENFALIVNCFINAGKTDQFINFPLLDYKTHAVVGTFRNGHLQAE